MSTLYVFAIGGTGERVLRSLVMELAGGMTLGDNWNTIKPVIIDSDQKSKAIENATALITEYKTVRTLYYNPDYIKGDLEEQLKESRMFKVEIQEPLMLNIGGEEAEDLSHFVEKEKLPDDLRTELDSLYSNQAQTMELKAGYVGNPSIGSIVLAETLKLADCEKLIKGITGQDGIFIVGSIFGGTGAAGIPLLINKIISQKKQVEGLKMGAMAVFPYFKLNKKENITDGFSQSITGVVRDDGFSIKTKAALDYYDKHVKGLSSMYYIGTGDPNFRSTFDYCVGGADQDNPACVIELIAANAIAHFAENAQGWTGEYIASNFGKGKEFKFTKYYQFKIGDKDILSNNPYDLSSLHTPDFRRVFVRLAFFWYIWEVCAPQYVTISGNQWASALGMDVNKLNKLKNKHLGKFIKLYKDWKGELIHDNHIMKFRFFNDNVKGDVEELFEMQESITQRFFPSTIACEKKGFLGLGKGVVNPNITDKMNKFENDKNIEKISKSESDDEKRFQRAIFSSISTIEKIVNDGTILSLEIS